MLCRLGNALVEASERYNACPFATPKDRIDAIIAHEYEELRAGGKHAEAIKKAAKTELSISDEARRLNRARAP